MARPHSLGAGHTPEGVGCSARSSLACARNWRHAMSIPQAATREACGTQPPAGVVRGAPASALGKQARLTAAELAGGRHPSGLRGRQRPRSAAGPTRPSRPSWRPSCPRAGSPGPRPQPRWPWPPPGSRPPASPCPACPLRTCSRRAAGAPVHVASPAAQPSTLQQILASLWACVRMSAAACGSGAQPRLAAAASALICSSSSAVSPAPALVSVHAWAATSRGRSVTALAGPAQQVRVTLAHHTAQP